VETAQNLVTAARSITGPACDLTGDIGRAVLAGPHLLRRPRVCARKVKSPLSRWNKHPDGQPRTTCRITSEQRVEDLQAARMQRVQVPAVRHAAAVLAGRRQRVPFDHHHALEPLRQDPGAATRPAMLAPSTTV
jgi:hypothetical protein